MIEFYKKNPICFICSIAYYVFSAMMLGGTFWSFVIALAIYLFGLMMVFSVLGEMFLRFLNGIRSVETNREREYLNPIFDEIYTRTGFKSRQFIEIAIIDKIEINACALGQHTIAVTKGAMATFTEDQLKGVLAHEFGHIRNKDTIGILYVLIGNGLFSILVFVFDIMIRWLEKIASWTKYKTLKFLCTIVRTILNAFVFVVIFTMKFALSFNSRKREYIADSYAQYFGYGEGLTDALYLLEQMNLNDNRKAIQKLTASHPRLTKRIEILEARLANKPLRESFLSRYIDFQNANS